MTQEEQDAILGRTLRDYKENRKKLAALSIRNEEIASSAKKLAHAVEQYPDRIHVSKGAEGTLALANALYVYSTQDVENLNPDFLRNHLAEYVSVQQRKSDLRQKLINLGADDPGE